MIFNFYVPLNLIRALPTGFKEADMVLLYTWIMIATLAFTPSQKQQQKQQQQQQQQKTRTQ